MTPRDPVEMVDLTDDEQRRRWRREDRVLALLISGVGLAIIVGTMVVLYSLMSP